MITKLKLPSQSDFKTFREDIKSLGGVWASENVYFSQMRDGYTAAYKPKYPEPCNKYMTIQTLWASGAYNRGNYELISYREGKFSSNYFNSIAEIKQFLEEYS